MKMKFTLLVLFSLVSLGIAGEGQTVVYPGLSTPNVFTNSNQFQSGVFLGPQIVANLPSLVGLSNLVYVSDGTSGSSPCTGGGTGSMAAYVNGAWTCAFGGGGGGGGNPAAPLGSIQYNNASAFGGIPGSSVTAFAGQSSNTLIQNVGLVRYASAFNWTQSPAGSLTGGTQATVTLTPCPLGVNGADTNLGIYIAGTGTAEAVFLQGGTCTGGLASGTIIFTPANSHTAGYTIQSGTAGLREAYKDNNKNDQAIVLGPSPANSGGVTFPYIFYTPFVIDQWGPISIFCNNAILEVWGLTNQNSAIMITGTQPVTLHECRSAASTVLHGQSITGTVCGSNVSTITSTLNPPVGARIDVQFTFNTHYWGVHTVTTTSLTQWTYTDNNCSGATSPGSGSIAFQATAGNNAPIYAMIEDQNGFGVRFENFTWSQPGSIAGQLNNGLVIEGDQHFVVTGNTGGGMGGCSATYCGSWIYMPGPFNGSNPPFNDNAAVAYITNNSMSLNCNWNGVTGYNGNTVSIINNVIQGQPMWSVNAGVKRGGFGTTTIIDMYGEVGGCSDPIYGGFAGVIQYGQSLYITGGEGPSGGAPSFGTGGGTTYYYWIVVHDTVGGISPPLMIGTCAPSGTTCAVNVPRADDNGTVTYDFLRSTDQDNAPTTSNCVGGSTTACGSVLLGVAQATGLTTTFTDTVTNNTTAYTVTLPTYVPIFPFFPGPIVLQSSASLNCYALNVASQECPLTVATNGYGPVYTDAPARKTTPQYLQIFTLATGNVSAANAALSANSALLLETVSGTVQQYAAKGRLNFFICCNAGAFAGTDIITLVDSNGQRTLAHMGLRPTLDIADSGIGIDFTGGSPSLYGIHIAAPVSITEYINTARDNASYLERLTSTLKTFKVPVTVTAPAGDSGYFNLVGNTANQATIANTFGFMGPPIATFTSLALQWNGTSYPSAAAPFLYCGAPVSNISPCSFTNLGGSNSALAGDILRYNVNADNLWDPVSYAQPFQWAYAVQDGMAVAGEVTSGGTFVGSGSNIFPTATYGFTRGLSASASASTSTVVGALCCTNGNNVLLPFLALWRFSERLQINTTTNARWWIGLANWNVGSSCGINNATIIGTTAYAADIPNKTTLAFRLSAGTDTTWTGISINCGGSPTSQTCSTGISPDTTAPHLYEIIPNAAGTAASFYIDGVFGCTISSNMPNVGLTFDSEAGLFFTGDNKNTATALTATWSFMKMAIKQ